MKAEKRQAIDHVRAKAMKGDDALIRAMDDGTDMDRIVPGARR